MERNCIECGEALNEKEVEANKDADYDLCFPCVKGNREEQKW